MSWSSRSSRVSRLLLLSRRCCCCCCFGRHRCCCSCCCCYCFSRRCCCCRRCFRRRRTSLATPHSLTQSLICCDQHCDSDEHGDDVPYHKHIPAWKGVQGTAAVTHTHTHRHIRMRCCLSSCAAFEVGGSNYHTQPRISNWILSPLDGTLHTQTHNWVNCYIYC